ncbi:heterokaryon incompatibility protein-domain-containing protein [Lasiosphaeris hirsuta]|uniref:Heterokaryon incompatibility protein-domain-containing protein n=2 Tax=Lasiosphaeris hirsuta TaxID=260670 RepID=A0AA40A1C3_9PEZI|nr:heterokaryon incompatibility protein-domain-containing protein [Lasiosphaeris hirsuta]
MLCYDELGQNEFRLLRVHSKKMSTISCELFHASLDHPPPYVAISYAWGDPRDTENIIISSVEARVTRSLHGALDALRSCKEDIIVWADAVCINQPSQEERSSQVKKMAYIYKNATSVAIWLGPEEEDSQLAVRFLKLVAEAAGQGCMQTQEEVAALIRDGSQVAALVSLFERPYWKRLWVVQEVLNAARIDVYCGSSTLPWDVYWKANAVFKQHHSFLDCRFPGSSNKTQRSFSDALAWCGPGSFPDPRWPRSGLLRVLRTCRENLASDPRDKVFGLLGVLPDITALTPDYSRTVKEVFTDVVDYELSTTKRCDVVCEAFPNVGATHMPSWVPDWSLVPPASSLGLSYQFDAAPNTEAEFCFSERRNKLTISAIYLDTVKDHGIAVGTACRLDDFLVAFCHARAMLDRNQVLRSQSTREAFCRALCVRQVPPPYESCWPDICYHAFSSLQQQHLRTIPLDNELIKHAKNRSIMPLESRFTVVEDTCGRRMRGRCLCLTKCNLIGMGSGLMVPGDIVVIPLGCYTPVLLRRSGLEEWRVVGDVYIDGYMDGQILKEWEDGKRELAKYKLC